MAKSKKKCSICQMSILIDKLIRLYKHQQLHCYYLYLRVENNTDNKSASIRLNRATVRLDRLKRIWEHRTAEIDNYLNNYKGGRTEVIRYMSELKKPIQ